MVDDDDGVVIGGGGWVLVVMVAMCECFDLLLLLFDFVLPGKSGNLFEEKKMAGRNRSAQKQKKHEKTTTNRPIPSLPTKTTATNNEHEHFEQ